MFYFQVCVKLLVRKFDPEEIYNIVRISVFVLILLLLCPLPLFALTVAGTGDSEAMLQRLALEFKRIYPESELEVPPSVGSSGGLRMLVQGRTDLARIARNLYPAEVDKGLSYKTFAVVPIVFIANLPEKCVTDLRAEQVLNIFSGKISSWAQLGQCSEQKIYLAKRERGDSSNRILEESIVGFSEINKSAGQEILTTPEALKIVSDHEYTLGYLPLSQMTVSHLVQFSYNGTVASLENVRSGQYELILSLALAWKEPLKEDAKKFIDFLKRSEAQDLIRSFGALPVLSQDQ